MKKLVMLLSLLVSQVGMADVFTFGKNQLRIEGPIRDMKQEAELVLSMLEDKGDKVIDIYIDTPGGSLTGAIPLTHALLQAKSEGFKIRCLVYSEAQSLGIYLLSQCDERFALPLSQLMWHHGSVGVEQGRTGTKGLRLMAEDMEMLDNEYHQTNINAMIGQSNQDRKLFEEFYFNSADNDKTYFAKDLAIRPEMVGYNLKIMTGLKGLNKKEEQKYKNLFEGLFPGLE